MGMTGDQSLGQARELYQAGKKIDARDVLVKAVISDPHNADLWFGLSYCIDDLPKKQDCLERVLFLNKDHPRARVLLEELLLLEFEQSQMPPVNLNTTIPAQPITTPPRKVTRTGVPEQIIANGISIEKPVAVGTRLNTTPIPDGLMIQTGMQAQQKAITAFTVVLAGIFLATFAAEYLPFRGISRQIYFSLVALISLISLILIFLKFRSSETWSKALRRGYGEKMVGSLLESLDTDHVIAHDVQTGYGTINHLIICKNGNVILIDVKTDMGRVSVQHGRLSINGRKQGQEFYWQTLRNSEYIRDEFSRLVGIKVHVTPVIVFTHAYVPYLPAFSQVFLMNQKYILRFIEGSGPQKYARAIWSKREALMTFLSQPLW